MADEMATAVILAGGHGECLRVGESYTPKVLLPVLGKPLLEHQLDWLKRSGLDSAVLCLGYKADAVRSYFGDGSRFGVRLTYLVEQAPRGTAGAVRALGPASLPDDIIVLYGDIFPEADLAEMLRFHRAHQALATLALHECEPAHAFECAAAVLGPSRKILELSSEAAPGRLRPGLSPLWILRRSLLHYVPENSTSDFIKDVFPSAIKSGETLTGYLQAGTLEDLGSPERYAKFSAARKRRLKRALS